MAVDFFLKLDGVPGESQDAKHKGEIDILSWDWGEKQTIVGAVGSGLGAGKVQMDHFHFTMLVNKASPKLMLACATGTHLKKAVLTARKAGQDQQEYFTVTLTDVLVTSYRTGGLSAARGGASSQSGPGGAASLPGGMGQPDSLPTDHFSLGFAMIQMEYKEQKADGSLGGNVAVKYNLKEMQAA